MWGTQVGINHVDNFRLASITQNIRPWIKELNLLDFVGELFVGSISSSGIVAPKSILRLI